MEHIRHFDWCFTEVESEYFLKEEDFEHSCTEKILADKFHDPLISSASEDEGERKIDWDKVFKKRNEKDKKSTFYISGLRPIPPYPKQSVLSSNQHYQMLKVISAEYPNVLEPEFYPRPTKLDYRLFEDLKEIYEKEKQEYIDWAKTLWHNGHNIRALRPKPQVEQIYKSEMIMRFNEVSSFPKMMDVAGHIPLTCESNCEFVAVKDLIKINNSDLPLVELPELFARRMTVLKPMTSPSPCNKHPCRFILPGEKSLTILPLTEIHRELAQYAADNKAQCIASENALIRLIETEGSWSLPVSVSSTIAADGDTDNIIVLGSEFSLTQQSSLVRTYKAYKHMLHEFLIPSEEKIRVIDIRKKSSKPVMNENGVCDDEQLTDSDDEEALVIDMDEDMSSENRTKTDPPENCLNELNGIESEPQSITETDAKVKDIYRCTCKETIHEWPPHRSYRKWEVTNKQEKITLIVHTPHKARGNLGEVILEPIPEYQIDVGASEISRDRLKALALGLHMRKNATATLVRVDALTGDLLTYDHINQEKLSTKHPDLLPEIFKAIHSTLSNLQGLLPGNYILRHDAQHGSNAILYSHSVKPTLNLKFDDTCIDDSVYLQKAPTITGDLLPIHKHRKILPCCFTPFPNQVAKEPRKPVTRQKTPPQAIKWPKRKKKNIKK